MRYHVWICIVLWLVILAACGGGSSIVSLPDDSGNPAPVVNPNPPVDNDPIVDPEPEIDPDKIALSDFQITSPADDAVVGGKTFVATNAESIDRLESVRILLDGKVVNTGSSCYRWDTTKASNGSHTIRIEALAGGQEVSREISVKVDNKTPVWDYDKSSSSLPNVTISGLDPETLFYSDSQGWIDLYGSGFNQLFGRELRINFCPSGYQCVGGWYGTNAQIVSDNMMKLYLAPFMNPIWGEYTIGMAVDVDQGGYVEYITAAVSSPGVLTVIGEDYDHRITQVSPSSIPNGDPGDDFTVDIYGVNFPQDEDYSITISRDLVEVGKMIDCLYEVAWSNDVDWLGPTHLQATFSRELWIDADLSPGDYVLHYNSVHWSMAVCYPIQITDSQPLQHPSLSISANPTSGDSPLTVQFTSDAHSNNPDGEIVEYYWDFEMDGSIDSQIPNPQHTYDLYGGNSKAFTAELFVVDNYGYGASDTVSILVNKPGSGLLPPLVDAYASPTSGNSPLAVQFSCDAASRNTGGSITSYEWDFNSDGVTDSRSQTPSRTFSANSGETKNVNVVLKVTDSFGVSATDSITVQVVGPSAGPSISYFSHSPDKPVTNGSGVDVTFNVGARAYDGAYIDRYKWDFDGNGTWDKITTSSQASWHYPEPPPGRNNQIWYANVKVIDSQGKSATDTEVINVYAGSDPRAYFGYSVDYHPDGGSARVTFTDLSSAFNDATIPNSGMHWDFDGDGQTDLVGGSVVSHSYYVPAGESSHMWFPSLTVTDSLGRSGIWTQSITVQGKASEPPEVDLSPSYRSGESPMTVTFNLTYSGNPIQQIAWYVDDQPVQAGGWQYVDVFSLNSNESSREYRVNVRVTDNQGYEVWRSSHIYVSRGSGGSNPPSGGNSDPDLPPIQIQGGNSSGQYSASNAQIGEGAPNESVRQAFLAAYSRAQGNAGNATTTVYSWNGGYVQDLAGGLAGPGAIMMKNGQSQAAWIHGDIYHKYIALGGASSYLGYPLQDEALGYVSSVTGAQNSFSLFSGDGAYRAEIVYHKNGPHQYGVYVVRGALYDAWERQNFGRGALGLPISDQYRVGNDWRSDFEGGYLVYRSSANRVDKYLNGQSSGGDPPSGGSIPSNIKTLFQQKRNSISTSELGYPTTEITKSGSVYYQKFDGGTGWIGALIYHPDRGQVYYVHGAIFNSWWGALGGLNSRLGLPISDEGSDPLGRRSNFDYGYIIWDAGNDYVYPYFYDGTPVDGTWTYSANDTVKAVYDWLVADLDVLDGTHSNDFRGYLEAGLVALSIGPERFVVKATQETAEKTVDTYKLVRGIIRGESAAEREVGETIAEGLARQGRPEFKKLVSIMDQNPEIKARLFHVTESPNLEKAFMRYIRDGGEQSVQFIRSLTEAMPNSSAEMLFDVTNILETGGPPLSTYLDAAGLPGDSYGVRTFLTEAAANGRVYLGRNIGESRIFFYHEPAKLLVEVNPNGAVESLVHTTDPTLNFSLTRYSDIVQIRKWQY